MAIEPMETSTGFRSTQTMATRRFISLTSVESNGDEHGFIQDLRPIDIRVRRIGPLDLRSHAANVECIGPWPEDTDVTTNGPECYC